LTSPRNTATSKLPAMTNVDRSKDLQKIPTGSSRSWDDGDLGDPLSNPAEERKLSNAIIPVPHHEHGVKQKRHLGYIQLVV
jgi:hypothetical protein